MLVDGPLADTRVGVELFANGVPDGEPADDEEYAPASGRHRAPARGWRVARVTQLGQDALSASARLVGEQVGMVIRETLAGMDRADLTEAAAAGLRASSVQLSFGVKLTAGTGKAIEAVVTAGGEASVQVVVTLDRPS
jgi:hypothetical protein